jgi:hypothetical protein
MLAELFFKNGARTRFSEYAVIVACHFRALDMFFFAHTDWGIVGVVLLTSTVYLILCDIPCQKLSHSWRLISGDEKDWDPRGYLIRS